MEQVERPSAINIFMKTLPYVFMRVAVYFLFGLVLILFLVLMGGIGFALMGLFEGASGPLFILGIVAIAGMIGLAVLAKRYVIYLVRIAHVAVMTEIWSRGSLPEGVNQIAYGKQKVIQHFGSASALFFVDKLVDGTVKQILNWLSRMTGFLGKIPGVKLILGIVRRILSLAASYIDEAIMSYIIMQEGKDIWQAAADGVVLYAQSWKSLLRTATIFVFCVAVAWAVGFLLILLPLLGLARSMAAGSELQILYSFIAVFIAFVGAAMIKWIFVDPMATVAMVISFNKAVEGMEPSMDLRVKLATVSGKFRRMLQQSGETDVSKMADDDRYYHG